MKYLLLALLAVAYAEVVGYILHRFLHLPPSWFERHRLFRPLRFVTLSHSAHHALSYGPRMKQRPPGDYSFVRHPEDVGLVKKLGFLLPEFSIPAIPFLAQYVLSLWAVGLIWVDILFCIGVTGAWVAFAFLYIHDTFHVRSHWLTEVPVFGYWYKHMRRAHDHHHTIIEGSATPYNFGILLPVDKIFGTWKEKESGLVIDELTGAVVSTPFAPQEYDAYYDEYRLEEPK